MVSHAQSDDKNEDGMQRIGTSGKAHSKYLKHIPKLHWKPTFNM